MQKKLSAPRPLSAVNRRYFLKAAGAALVMPAIVPGSVFGQNSPSKRITLGVVGWGMQGPGNTKSFLAEADCQVVAVRTIAWPVVGMARLSNPPQDYPSLKRLKPSSNASMACLE